MLYLYDEAIAEDLSSSFNTLNGVNPVVKVVDSQGIVQLIAAMQEDDVSFPIVVINRNPDNSIDTTKTNFTRMKKGVAAVIDVETNELYYEKVIPVKLSYEISVLATNTADRDELVRELIFKYMSMYFITFTLPYECRRRVRFGIEIDSSSEISNQSGTFDYIDGGKLYETTIPIRCEGAVIVSYTPVKLKRHTVEVEPK